MQTIADDGGAACRPPPCEPAGPLAAAAAADDDDVDDAEAGTPVGDRGDDTPLPAAPAAAEAVAMPRICTMRACTGSRLPAENPAPLAPRAEGPPGALSVADPTFVATGFAFTLTLTGLLRPDPPDAPVGAAFAADGARTHRVSTP